jgi:hypothetical protein
MGSSAATSGALQWTYSGTQRISPGAFLGYGGGAMAFILSLIGALQNLGALLEYVEDSLDTWLGVYSDDGSGLKSYI